MDCLDGMSQLEDRSIDLILCDLPYGVTKNTWDTIIPFPPLWKAYKRLIKPQGAIVLTASSDFTNTVIQSNKAWYRYKWIWVKSNVTNPLNAKNRPMNNFEEILVFSKATTANHSRNKMNYFPQGLQPIPKHYRQATSLFDGRQVNDSLSYTNYPKDVLFFSQDTNRFHPTQKPVALFEYLIQTYTKRDDLVLDHCMGSGTTAVACLQTGRNYIGFETNEAYYHQSQERIKEWKNQIRLF